MNFTDILKTGGALDQLDDQFGLDKSQVESIVEGALPKITENINNNASSKDGLKSFWDALNDHKDAPVEEMLSDVNKVDTTDGEKILGHIFGEDKPAVEEELSQMQGLSAASVGGIMRFLAPIIMGMIGRQVLGDKKPQVEAPEPTMKEGQGGGLLDSLLGGDSAVTKMAKSFLDKNKDGSIIDDLLGKMF